MARSRSTSLASASRCASQNSGLATLLTFRHHGKPPVTPCLTPREFEVLKLLAYGRSSREIAGALGITFKTAASHRSRILSKLSVHETVIAVSWAIRNGLLES